MTFNKLAYNLAFLQSITNPAFTKKAGLMGRIARGAGKKIWGQAVRENGVFAPLTLAGGAVGLGASAKSGVSQTRASMAGFDPRVLAAKREMGNI